MSHQNHGGRIHEPVAEGVRYIATHGVGAPILGNQVGWPSGSDHNVLHVAPGKPRVRFEHEGADTGRERRRGGGASVVWGAGMVEVGGCNLTLVVRAATVGGGQGRRAGLTGSGCVSLRAVRIAAVIDRWSLSGRPSRARWPSRMEDSHVPGNVSVFGGAADRECPNRVCVSITVAIIVLYLDPFANLQACPLISGSEVVDG